jgi:hypothetical protein
MSKPRTIGENPLDLVVSENHLETVVAGSSSRRGNTPADREGPSAVEQRLMDLEAENRRLKTLVGELRLEVGDLKNQVFRASWWVSQMKHKLGLK